MKKILLSTALLLSGLLFTLSGNAQIYSSSLHPESDFGIKAGANFQQIAGSPFVPAYNTGFVAGLYGAKHWDKVGLRIEVLVSNAQMNTEHPVSYGMFHEKGSDSTSKGDFKAMYVSIPVLLEAKMSKRVNFEIGPQYNYMLSFTDNNGAYTKQFKNDKILKTGEVCLALGFNFKLPYKLNLDLRYVKGITDINKNTYYRALDAWNNNAGQVTLSYKLY